MAAFTTTYHYENGADFPVEWVDENIAAQSYWWNSQHTPFAITPLSTDYLMKVWSLNGVRSFVHFSTGDSIDTIIHPHGYMYVPQRPPTPPVNVDADIQKIHDRFTTLAPTIRQDFEEEDEPKIHELCRELQKTSDSSIAVSDLATRLREMFDLAADRFDLTMMAAGPMMAAHLPLVAFCQREFDEDAGALVEALEGGFSNRTTSADAQLWKLSHFLRTNPDVLELLQSDKDAAASPNDSQFSKGLSKYLEQYGFRAEVWFELSTPTQAEDPRLLLAELQRAAATDEPDPQLATAKSARARRATTRRLRKQLAREPGKLAEFDRALETARQYVPIKESRGYWQMTISGSLRVLCLAAGRMLVNEKILELPEDIFYLHLEEIDKVSAAPNSGDWKELVATRRSEHASRMATNPPANIGGVREATANVSTNGPAVLAKGEVLKGLAASAGAVEGRAVVVKTLSEASKLEAGDILVCNSTSPAWSMLFSRISAVVTTGGGPLSHTAIVAREYKIPCVLNVEGVTSRVQDGMRIRVDGTKGTVELIG